MHEVDVVIVGAGPSGATAALNLAPTRRVVMVERGADTAPRIGEALPPAAQRLLADMGLLNEFMAESHLPCLGNRAIWGHATPSEADFLHDLDGHGWHIDRARFDTWLRHIAVRRGAVLMMPARLDAITRDGARWRVMLTSENGSTELSTAVVIDCGGRAAPAARRLGARRETVGDRLVCGWLIGKSQPCRSSAGFSFVEAVEDGWLYTAPMPAGQRTLAFFTDADLPARQPIRDGAAVLKRAQASAAFASLLADTAFVPLKSGMRAAHTAFLNPCAGYGWIAAGDASISFDPISSQGLLHALFTGLAAAETADRFIAGSFSAMDDYRQVIDGIARAYWRHLTFYYSTETRWADAPFWQRRDRCRDSDAHVWRSGLVQKLGKRS